MTDEQHHPERLFPEFNPATAADWEERTRKELRDKPLESLVYRTYEGIDLKPYYTKEDIRSLPKGQQNPGSFPFMRGRRTGINSWLNIQHIKAAGNGKAAIDIAADALSRGADGVLFIIREQALFDVPYLVQNLDLSKKVVNYTIGQEPDLFLKRIYAELKKKQVSPLNLKGFINYEPLSNTGKLDRNDKKIISKLLDLTKVSTDFYGITVCGTSFSSIGASATQEIAYTLSAAVAYIDHLTNAGESLEAVLRNMQLFMAAGTNYFMEIVKFRVIRLLWSTIVEAYNAEPALAAQLRIHCTTSSWYQTTLGANVNMLRVTTEAMSAIIAGCDSLAVMPFDYTFHKPEEFSARIARNVSVILKEEAYLDKAIDPAAGSYYLEYLTDALASKAWDLFREVEAKGGFEAAYQEGFILDSVTNVSREKFRNIAIGKDVLVGTNKYPDPKEKIDFDPEELIQSADFDTTRAAYPTEVMRMAIELHLRKRKRRPKVIVAVIGQAEQRQLNASFAQELFSCAGFDTEEQHYASVDDAADRLLHAAAEVVVVSASKGNYTREFGPKLRTHQGKPTIILAENPQLMKDELIAQGFDEFLFENCDTSTILRNIYKRLSQEGEDDS
ncbi:methylmalonyl-CoA mutase family protein [Pontibacter silvestris]|uniref:Methylmalonyl-CoA mutase family protein n=1 Tax=Pontibacter silvestris TaxID=2305183 RepID=A0ABW4X445_9BACT|nr:methylmalonyl-CoA mutase family protein [Pontibacter silvestris]MCC9137892.1 methylmalonyl-CoA mutase family protein [Pontibacter silvestris]